MASPLPLYCMHEYVMDMGHANVLNNLISFMGVHINSLTVIYNDSSLLNLLLIGA